MCYESKDGKVVQDKCIAIPKSKGAFTLKGYKRQPQTVYYSMLYYCERNRVVSFEDDYPRFKQMIIDDLEARVEETKNIMSYELYPERIGIESVMTLNEGKLYEKYLL